VENSKRLPSPAPRTYGVAEVSVSRRCSVSEDAGQHSYEDVMRAFADAAQLEEAAATRAFHEGYAEGVQAARDAHYDEVRDAARVVVSALRTVGGAVLKAGALFTESAADAVDVERGEASGASGDFGSSGDGGGGFDAAVYINYDG
jgi:hypothetical protein